MYAVRYAHCEGYTDVCFAGENGAKFLTCGEDGDVRIWQGYDDLDNTSFRVGDKCFALAYKAGKVYVADELNELKDSLTQNAVDFRDNESAKLLLKVLQELGRRLDSERTKLDLDVIKLSEYQERVLLRAMDAALKPFLVFAHVSAEAPHARWLARIEAEPLLSLGLRLGEGSGAVLALPLLRAACALLAEMATFDSAGVSDRP